jgi:hypothetical protein
MSDHWIVIIPADPAFVPSPENAERVEAELRNSVVSCDEVAVETHDTPVFFDAGSNWEGVRCPACGAAIDVDAWSDAMAAAHKSGDLSLNVRCCGASTNLNALTYAWRCGFARFALSARNPERSFSEESADRIAEILGTPVKIVRRHL